MGVSFTVFYNLKYFSVFYLIFPISKKFITSLEAKTQQNSPVVQPKPSESENGEIFENHPEEQQEELKKKVKEMAEWYQSVYKNFNLLNIFKYIKMVEKEVMDGQMDVDETYNP